MNQEVLVLNSDYEPLNICNIRRAISLVFLGKVDVLHEDSRTLHTVSTAYRSPSVVRLRNHVRRPMPQLKLSRRAILARDNYTCQYCGHKGSNLTIDHVIPRRLGGQNTWDNLVACCSKCNAKKGGKLLSQLNYTLQQQPRKPKYVPFISLTKFVAGAKHEAWRDYLPVLDSPSAGSNESAVVATAP
ncbi:MAG: HNH endonuclease [Armatimonadota bacterium]|nr:HNH endonuclease [bacterium]